MSVPTLTPAQAQALAVIRERGHLNGGTRLYAHVPRTATVKRLEALGLITLSIRYGTYYGRDSGKTYAYDEWTARPVVAA